MPTMIFRQTWRDLQMRFEAKKEVLRLRETHGERAYEIIRERLSQPELRTRYRTLLRQAAASLTKGSRIAARSFAKRISSGEVSGTFTDAEARQSGLGAPETARAALELLQRAGWIRPGFGRSREDGSAVWEVNPNARGARWG